MKKSITVLTIMALVWSSAVTIKNIYDRDWWIVLLGVLLFVAALYALRDVHRVEPSSKVKKR